MPPIPQFSSLVASTTFNSVLTSLNLANTILTNNQLMASNSYTPPTSSHSSSSPSFSPSLPLSSPRNLQQLDGICRRRSSRVTDEQRASAARWASYEHLRTGGPGIRFLGGYFPNRREPRRAAVGEESGGGPVNITSVEDWVAGTGRADVCDDGRTPPPLYKEYTTPPPMYPDAIYRPEMPLEPTDSNPWNSPASQSGQDGPWEYIPMGHLERGNG
ncbi:hypothetical protein TWF481_001431 [Arthrobotrys musiformis]|uniref:Uncharacterized protein n=1 Tax=Arthrobotrys musiformis TaxID=47236 RepID=A0AAV9WQT6_9PEZI